jgi:outer membrane protein TolC
MKLSILVVHRLTVLLTLLLSLAGLPAIVTAQPQGGIVANSDSLAAAEASKPLSLEECLDIALKKSHRRPASQFAVAMAEAQHRQALAGYWPQVNFQGGYQRLSDPLNFVFPASAVQIPAQSITVPSGMALVTIPANAFGPGFPPTAVQLPVSYPGQNITTPAQNFPIPEQNIKVVDNDILSGTIDIKWLLYDGGMRKGLREQSGGQLEMMRQEARRTDLEITDTVKRFYWGAVLAGQLHQLGEDTLSRLEVTLRLTESLYKGGSGQVTKADYLDNQVMVESVRAMVADLEKNEKMAQAALANTMGLPWNVSVKPSAEDIPFQPYTGNLEELVSTSYQFSPDWGKLEAGLQAAEGAVTTAKSEYYPKLALTGQLHRWWNDGYSAGMATAQNKAGWSAGVGIEVPLFNGFLTQNKVSETRARVNQLKETQILLREGLGLQVKDLVLGLDAALKADQATSRAMKSAQDNRDLNTRAYENGLVETDKVIRAQLVEALMSAQHYAARYQYTALLSQLDLIVGTEVQQKLSPVH